MNATWAPAPRRRRPGRPGATRRRGGTGHRGPGGHSGQIQAGVAQVQIAPWPELVFDPRWRSGSRDQAWIRDRSSVAGSKRASTTLGIGPVLPGFAYVQVAAAERQTAPRARATGRQDGGSGPRRATLIVAGPSNEPYGQIPRNRPHDDTNNGAGSPGGAAYPCVAAGGSRRASGCGIADSLATIRRGGRIARLVGWPGELVSRHARPVASAAGLAASRA